jgi:hypothetical protein
LAKALVVKGAQRAKLFNWDETARKYADVFQSLQPARAGRQAPLHQALLNTNPTSQ